MTNILVVDDSPVDRRLIGGLLERQSDWTVCYASDGCDALQQLGQESFRIIITDLQMPNLDGLQLVREVRSQWPLIPVLLVTSHGSEQIAIEALRAGAANYSPKSKLNSDLASTVRHVLELSGQTRQRNRPAQLLDHASFAYVMDNDTRMIGPLIDHLQDNLPGWTEPDRVRIGMALAEALTNAIYHGNLEVSSQLRDGHESMFWDLIAERKNSAPYASRRIRFQASLLPEEIRFCITDEGPGFDPSSIPDPTTYENLEKLSGRGLLLIQSFMDHVTHNTRGNQITLIKRVPSGQR